MSARSALDRSKASTPPASTSETSPNGFAAGPEVHHDVRIAQGSAASSRPRPPGRSSLDGGSRPRRPASGAPAPEPAGRLWRRPASPAGARLGGPDRTKRPGPVCRRRTRHSTGPGSRRPRRPGCPSRSDAEGRAPAPIRAVTQRGHRPLHGDLFRGYSGRRRIEDEPCALPSRTWPSSARARPGRSLARVDRPRRSRRRPGSPRLPRPGPRRRWRTAPATSIATQAAKTTINTTCSARNGR